MLSFAQYLLALLLLLPQCNAQCLANEFTIEEEAPNGTVVGNLFDRDVSRALSCLVALLPPNESSADLGRPASETILLVMAQIGPPILRDERFGFRDGNVIVVRRINREALCPTKPRCSLDLSVSFIVGGNRAVFPVRVIVRDKDDNEPSWHSWQSVVGFYEQLDSKRKQFFGNVIDLDAVRDNFTTLRFDFFDPSGVFELTVVQADSPDEHRASYDVFLGVRSGAKLDRETRSSYPLHTCIRQQRSRFVSSQAFLVEMQSRSVASSVLHSAANNCVAVNVTVLDDNDNPPIVTPNGTVRLNVSEQTPVGQVIFRFNATDLDEGINAELRFRFAASQSDRDTFAINDLGELSIRRKLDFEATKHYVLKIDVADSSSKPQTSTVEVLIGVLDENDEYPSLRVDPSSSNPSVSVLDLSALTGARYPTSDDADSAALAGGQLITKNVTIFVQENTLGELVELTVTDRDSGSNGRVLCTLLERSSRLFLLRPIASGVNFAIDTSERLDAENARHTSLAFAVLCADGGRPPLRTLLNARVSLVDANDNAPRFATPYMNASIDENLDQGAYVTHVLAEDPDASESGTVRYQLLHADQVPFRIDERTGEITTRMRLDRESVDSYVLLIVAADGGNQSLSATATLTVHVNDVNDQAPRFDRNMYVFYVAEELPSETFIGHVNASDRDAADNAKITYSLACDNLPVDEATSGTSLSSPLPQQHARTPLPFAINTNSGELIAVSRLDREAFASYTFRVCATDGGFPSQSSFTHVTVNVQDVNDNSPSWLFPNSTHFVVNLTRSLPIGGTVTTVRAHDPDSFENGSIIYSIIAGNQKKLFQLDPLDGTLLIGRQLQVADLNQVHRLQLEAADRPLIGDARTTTQYIVIVMMIEHGQLELARREEQPFSDLSFVIVLAIGTVTMLLTLFLIVVCICMIQKKRSRAENRRERRRPNDRSRTVSRASSKHNVTHTSFKTQPLHDPINTFHASFSDHCLSKLATTPLYKESTEYFADRTSNDGGAQINDDVDGTSSAVCKFYDEGCSRYDGRVGVAASADASDEYDEFLKRWVVALSPAATAIRERSSETVDKHDSIAQTRDCVNRSVPSILAQVGAQPHSTSSQRSHRLATFASHRHSRAGEDAPSHSAASHVDASTPMSDQGPSLDSMQSNSVNQNQNQKQITLRNRSVTSNPTNEAETNGNAATSKSVHTTPVKKLASNKQRRRNSKPNIYTCLSHSAAPSQPRFEHTALSIQKHNGTPNFPLQDLARPPLIDIAAYNCASRQVDTGSQNAPNVHISTPQKHPVSPITTYMTRSPTTPCIDEYRPAQSTNAPACSSRRNNETACEDNDNDDNANNNSNSNSNASAPGTRCTSALSHTQTTFV